MPLRAAVGPRRKVHALNGPVRRNGETIDLPEVAEALGQLKALLGPFGG